MQISGILSISVALVALTVSLVLNGLFRDSLFKMGLNFILEYQANYSSSFVTAVQNIISILGNTYFIVAFLALVHLLFFRKLNTFVYLCYIVFNAYLISVSKQAFQEPRPFYYDQQIKQLEWSCPRSFGFPSGHSWISVLLFEPVISDLIGTEECKKWIMIWIVLTGVLIPLSRQYLGAHSADQVTFGLLNSLVWLILYKFLFQQYLYRLMRECLRGAYRKSLFALTTIFFVLSWSAPFVIYSVNTNDRIFSGDYLNLLNIVCKRDVTMEDIQKEAGTAAAIIGLSFGIIYGLIISGSPRFRHHFEVITDGAVSNRFNSYLLGKWGFKGEYCNVLKYFIVYVIFGGVLIGGLGFGVPKAISNFYGSYIVQTLAYCAFGLSMTSFIPAILFSCSIIDEEEKDVAKGRSNLRTDNQADTNVL